MTERQFLLGMAALGMVGTAMAEAEPPPIETRHGAVTMPAQPVAVEGGFTAVLQIADDNNIDGELLGSFDLVTTLPAGKGDWIVYVEGNTSPRDEGVSSQLGEANGDAGSALDRDGKGRFQVSELHYLQPLGEGVLVVGLLDASTSLDGSAVANDETTQFLSAPLVNNPTIGFPDYSLGVVFNHETSEDSGYSLVLTSSHGLADNPDASYAQLVDVTDDGKGVFFAAEGQWPVMGSQVRAGAWVNSADHARLSSSGTEKNYGLYVSIDGKAAAGQWNLRAGLANEKVALASQFLSLAWEKPLNSATLGLGLAYAGLSGKASAPQQDDMLLAEANLRFQPWDGWQFTPIVQWINNSGFDASGTVVDEEQLLFAVRLSRSF